MGEHETHYDNVNLSFFVHLLLLSEYLREQEVIGVIAGAFIEVILC